MVQRNKLQFEHGLWQARDMDVLSFQSRVVWGYVGNAIAVPMIQHFGLNAWPIDTVVLSHHPGHGAPIRHTPSANEISNLSSQVLKQLQFPMAALIGYLGNAEQGTTIKKVLDQNLKSDSDITVYLDPVFGDDAEGIYVDNDIVTFFHDVALPMADVVMPNCFELAYLANLPVHNVSDAIDAARIIIARGPSLILASSIPSESQAVLNVLVTHNQAWVIKAPYFPLKAKGTGDMLSATFTALHAGGAPAIDAFRIAVSTVQHAVIDASNRGLIELDLPRILAGNTQKIDDMQIDEI